MNQRDRDWEAIIRIHGAMKLLILRTEELDPIHEFFWPPIIQQRDALDHIIRAQRAIMCPEILPAGTDASQYEAKQIDKALGHVYRAYFDVADWMGIMLRERILELVARYARESLVKAIPDYAVSVEDVVRRCSERIAILRNGKDVVLPPLPDVSPSPVSSDDSDNTLEAYQEVIDELQKCIESLQDKVPELDRLEYASK